MSHNWKAAVSFEGVTPSKVCDTLADGYEGFNIHCERRNKFYRLSESSSSVKGRLIEVREYRVSCRRATSEGRTMEWLRFRKYNRW